MCSGLRLTTPLPQGFACAALGDKKKTAGGNMPASNSRSDVEFALWTMVCPITNSLFEEPVVAEDGKTYSKRALLAWFESCKARGLPITSPCTREEISEDTKPNLNMIQAVLHHKGEGAAREKALSCMASLPPARAEAGSVGTSARLQSPRRSVATCRQCAHSKHAQ